MGLPEAEAEGANAADCPPSADDGGPRSAAGCIAARCWALLLARIYEGLPLVCPCCGEPMRIIAFILDPPQVERILTHLGEPAEPPTVWPARAPPQGELGFAEVDHATGQAMWPEIDQTGDDDNWD